VAREVIVGEVSGAYGIKGWVKIHSFTEPAENILGYAPWTWVGESDSGPCIVLEGRRHGNAVVARLSGIDSREQAETLKFRKISVSREQLPEAEPGHYYWVDLVGLAVDTVSGLPLGTVDSMMATGANDVMIVNGDRERLIPFVVGEFVKRVDLNEGRIVVDWDPDF
jgi:16S rRNA processing protein RimM